MEELFNKIKVLLNNREDHTLRIGPDCWDDGLYAAVFSSCGWHSDEEGRVKKVYLDNDDNVIFDIKVLYWSDSGNVYDTSIIEGVDVNTLKSKCSVAHCEACLEEGLSDIISLLEEGYIYEGDDEEDDEEDD